MDINRNGVVDVEDYKRMRINEQVQAYLFVLNAEDTVGYNVHLLTMLSETHTFKIHYLGIGSQFIGKLHYRWNLFFNFWQTFLNIADEVDYALNKYIDVQPLELVREQKLVMKSLHLKIFYLKKTE